MKRNAQALEDAQSGDAAEDIALFILWIQGVFDLRQRAEQLSESEYQQEAMELLAWLKEYVEAEPASEDNRRFAQRLLQMQGHLVPFIEQLELPATNNLAERQIRPAVVHRKSAAGNKTDAGAKALAILASLAATCRQQSKYFAQIIQRILTAPPEQPILFWQMSDPVPE